MIVDSDVEAEAFATTGVYPKDMAGYSAWEPYAVTIPITISSEDQSQTITITVEDPLEETDMISLSSTQIDIPTYLGVNMITVDTEVRPSEMYIKFLGRIYGAFLNARELEYIQIPKSVISIGAFAFQNTKLKKVMISKKCRYYPSSFPSDCEVLFYEDIYDQNYQITICL
jgi:hypothetical protein